MMKKKLDNHLDSWIPIKSHISSTGKSHSYNSIRSERTRWKSLNSIISRILNTLRKNNMGNQNEEE
jgi:hypothetical protein